MQDYKMPLIGQVMLYSSLFIVMSGAVLAIALCLSRTGAGSESEPGPDSPTPTATATASPSRTATNSPTPTATATASRTPTPTATQTHTASPTGCRLNSIFCTATHNAVYDLSAGESLATAQALLDAQKTAIASIQPTSTPSTSAPTPTRLADTPFLVSVTPVYTPTPEARRSAPLEIIPQNGVVLRTRPGTNQPRAGALSFFAPDGYLFDLTTPCDTSPLDAWQWVRVLDGRGNALGFAPVFNEASGVLLLRGLPPDFCP